MEKNSYQYLIAELRYTPELIRELVHEAQINFGQALMMVDEALLEKDQFPEGEYEAFLPDKVKSELELESNYFSTNLSYNAVFQLTCQWNYFYNQEETC